MPGGSSSKKSSSQGAWLGSEIYEGHIEALRHRRLLPPASRVLVQIPGPETAPTPSEGEIVVFDEHFYTHFGIPASPFLSKWLHFFGVQPHHLAPNAILQLSAFVVLCEGFLGIEPRLDLWRSLFFFKQQSIAMDNSALEKHTGPRPMMPCGAALVHHRSKSGFPQMPLQESIKKWQKGFFYVKNVNPAHDALNMLPFNINPPTKLNWGVKFPKPIPEVAQIGAHLDILEKRGFLGCDLLTTMVTGRILPLQRRPHLVCQMSGRHDPCRTFTKRFTPSAVEREVNLISTARMDDSGNWAWGMIPYSSRLVEPAINYFAQVFEKLQAALNPPAPHVATSDASEIEDEGMNESHLASSEGTENALESEGTEPSGEHLRPSIVDWTDDDETPSSLCDAAFEKDSNGVEKVTSPPLMHRGRQGDEAAGPDEAARKKGKGATASRPAPKRPAMGPPAGARTRGAKKRRGGGRRQVPIVAVEAGDVEEDTASAAERAGWTAVDSAQKELEVQSKRRWDAATGKTAEGQSRPSRAEKPAEKRTKARHDASTRARVEEPASEAAPRHAPRTKEAHPSEPDASALVDLEVIPNSPRAEAAPDAPELILDAPDVARDAPGVNMDAPDAAHPPPVQEAAPAGTSAEPAAMLAPGDGTIVVSHHGPAAPGAGARVGSRPMKTWRAANLARSKLPVGTAHHGIPKLVSTFTSSRFKLYQAACMVGGDLERLEERTRDLYDAQVQAYNTLRAQNQAADGQTEKKELEAASRAELEQLRASLQEKDTSHTSDVECLETLHLGEMKLKDAALKEKEDALVQKQTQLAKALDSAAALQDEVAGLTQASKVRELEALESTHETDSDFNHESSFVLS
ncbi:hypothetical protein ZWY2020_058428 [Hordeum vulgare]|nr:hypothetical protein ZWY2020_058428 [Hordeum vulgare]